MNFRNIVNKIYFNNIIFLILISCTDDSGESIKDNLQFQVSSDECVLSQAKSIDKALEITWSSEVNDESTKYIVKISPTNQGQKVWQKTYDNKTHSLSFSNEELNQIIIDKFKIYDSNKVDLKVLIEKVNSKHWILQSHKDSTIVHCTSYIPIYPNNNHKAPLYWSPYEYNYVNNSFIPEDEFKKNIDWVADNLKNYGYNLISTDGWLTEHDIRVCNKNGYLDKMSIYWEHDYSYWSDYCKSKGLKFGLYANPLWVPYDVATSNILIEGTNIPVSNIVNLNEFRNGHNYYWVQLDADGAEEWVKGYIKHYAKIGISFLRVDFMSFFEDGKDRFRNEPIGPERPHWMYQTALRWMREECDKYGIFLSIVMNHGYNDAETEKNYAHSIRVSSDTEYGTWDRFSNIDKGQHFNMWMQWGNPFDGCIYFSRISGRNKIFLDTDFIRLNTMKNDDECMSIISFNIISGSIVGVNDRYNSIGDRLSFYQNRELLELNKDGFVGKPISNDPNNEKSSIWTGEMSNGDQIIAYFNRTDNKSVFSFKPLDFQIDYKFFIRDLWKHTNIPENNSYDFAVNPHGCVILRIYKTNEK